MGNTVFDELSKINMLVSTTEKYERLRQLYCKNQDVEVIALAYAKLLSRLNGANYLQRALKICNRIPSNSKYLPDIQLIRYQITKKLNPNQDPRILMKELESIDLSKENIKNGVWFEKLLLCNITDTSYETIKKGYVLLLKSCADNDFALRNAICNKLFSILIKKKEYDEVLKIIKYLRDNNYLVSNIDRTEFYANYKLGNIIPSNYDLSNVYYENQILNYNEELAIKHIQKRHTCVESKNEPTAFFNSNLNIEDLFYNVKMYISNIQPSDSSSAIDVYFIPTEKSIGRADDQTSSTIKVITEIDTKNIHTMLPISLRYDSLVQRGTNSFIKIKKIKL